MMYFEKITHFEQNQTSKFAACTKKESAVAKRFSLCHIWIIQISRVVLMYIVKLRKLMGKGKMI